MFPWEARSTPLAVPPLALTGTQEIHGAEYVAVCLPAFSPGTIQRDD